MKRDVAAIRESSMKRVVLLTALILAAGVPAWSQPIEYGKDRPGSDIASFNLPANGSPEMCQGACVANAQCVAWTFVRTGWQGPAPRCWLKNSAPAPVDGVCCASGHK